MFNLFASKRINFYQVTVFFVVAFVTAFLALNFVPYLIKSGNSSAADADVSMEVGVAISLNLSKESISLETIPTREGEFVYDTTVAKVSTNNTTGYTLTMNTVTDQTALADEGRTIPSITATQSVTAADQSSFTKDAWGYAKSNGLNTSGSTTFNQIPSLSAPATIASSEDPVTEDATPITYGTKISTNTITGEYQNMVAFTATTNYVPQTFGGIMYMQEMTADICAAETTPTKDATTATVIHTSNASLVPEAVFTDSRDGEQYIVRKLADGNCWMSQNLRLVGERTLTSADSDVISDFTLPAHFAGVWASSVVDSAGANTARVYDTGNTEHGAYYNWYTAIAGSANYDSISGNASSSICPKGWKLPASGSDNTDTGSFPYLINTYLGSTESASWDSSSSFWKAFGASLSGSYKFSGSLEYQDYYGLLWSSSPKPSPVYDTYRMYYNSAYVSSYGGTYKVYGVAVRCVARGEQYTINFNSSEADSGIASASVDLGGNIDLAYYSSLFKKSGYAAIKQWRDQDGNLYDAASTSVNVNPENKQQITLTATWEPIKFFPSTLTTMQGMTADICNSVTTPSKDATAIATSQAAYMDSGTQVPQVTLRDTRDNNTYTVRKLADGNCWMTQNLRIVGSRTLTSADSDVSSNYTLPTPTTTGFSSSNPGYYTAQVAPVNTEYGNGAYYSWTAATAGTGTSSITAQNAEAPSSVCPKGWRLPYSGTTQTGSKSFKYLMDAYGYTTGDQITAQPLQFAYSGRYYSSSFVNGGSNGSYWSSTARSSNYAYSLSISSLVSPQDYYDRYRGFSVRCVAR